jgi:hypothetical protein
MMPRKGPRRGGVEHGFAGDPIIVDATDEAGAAIVKKAHGSSSRR